MEKDSKQYKLPERELSAGYLVNWAARLYAREMDAALRPLGLSSAHLPVLFALAGVDALTQRDLARIAAVEQPTMASTLTRMERDGLIARSPDPNDRRVSRVVLTGKARALLDGVAAAVARINGQSLSGLSAEEQALFRALLQRVIGALDGSKA